MLIESWKYLVGFFFWSWRQSDLVCPVYPNLQTLRWSSWKHSDTKYLIRFSIYQQITSIFQSITSDKYLICVAFMPLLKSKPISTKWKTELLRFSKIFMARPSSTLISIGFKIWKFSKSCFPLSFSSQILFFFLFFFSWPSGVFLSQMIANSWIFLSNISASFSLVFVVWSVKFSF